MMDAYKHFVDVLKDKTTEQFESEDSSDDETEQRRRIESTDTAESGQKKDSNAIKQVSSGAVNVVTGITVGVSKAIGM